MKQVIPAVIYLNKNEIDALKKFCDDNIVTGVIEVRQDYASGIGYATKVMVRDLPETLTDITDYDAW